MGLTRNEAPDRFSPPHGHASHVSSSVHLFDSRYLLQSKQMSNTNLTATILANPSHALLATWLVALTLLTACAPFVN